MIPVHPNMAGRIWDVLQYLGRASYCIFLVQMPLFLWMQPPQPAENRLAPFLRDAPYTTLGLIITAVLLLGIVMHECVEKPARRLVMRRLATTE